MNKIYKLVYSKTLNSLVAVSEIATSAQAGSNKNEVTSSDLKKSSGVSFAKLAWTFLISSLFSALPLAVSANDKTVDRVELGAVPTATADTDATKDAHLNYASKLGFSAENAGVVGEANGPSVKYVQNVPVVNIKEANQAGVSDNRFSKFSTDTGAVFNNLKNGSVAVNSSLLAEKLDANPNLKEAARVILAQVTGNDKSVISGTLEILGQKADLLVINPNGIDLNGVDLVNMKEFTASTAEVNADNATKQLINKGEINVNGSLNANDVDVIRLLAAAVKVKAQISASKADGKKPNIVVGGGKQKFTLADNTAEKVDNTVRDEVVISGEALGSMYGKNVNFVVTESGAGVKYDGMIIGEEDLKITADGKVVVKDTYSKGTTTLQSTSSDVELAQDATVKSQSKIVVDAKASALTTLGTLHASEEVKVTSGEVSRLGNVQAEKVQLDVQNLVTEKGTKLKSKELTVNVKQVAEFGGKVGATDKLTVTTANPGDVSQATSDAQLNVLKNTYLSQVRFNDEVLVQGTADIKAAKVAFNGSDATKEQFVFGDVNIEVNNNGRVGGLELTGGKFVANNLGLSVYAADNLTGKPLVTTNNGSFSVYQTASLDLNKANKLVTLNNNEQFKNLNDTVNTLNATLTKVKAGNVEVGAQSELTFDKAVTFEAENFKNEGAIEAKSSFSAVAKNKVEQNGLLLVGGNLVLNAGQQVDLHGATFSYANTTLQAKKVEQSGRLNVGGNLDVTADSYKLVTKFSGDVGVAHTHSIATGTNWHYHALRKDKYVFQGNLGALDTSKMTFNTTETSVAGNFTVKSLSQTPDTNNERLVIENGRLHVGGNADIDGSLIVKTTTFDLPLQKILQLNSPVRVTYQPITLINTALTNPINLDFVSLYDFFNKVFTGQVQRKSAGNIGYTIEPMQIINSFKQASIDVQMLKVINKALGSDWKALDYVDLAKRWRAFLDDTYYERQHIDVFAPNSEVFVGKELNQRNGKLFVGADKELREATQSDKAKYGLGTKVVVENTADVLLTEKISGVRKTSDYVNLLDKQLKLKDGKYVLAHAPSWEGTSNISSTLKNGTAFADDAALSAIAFEQYKDLVGGYLTTGKDQKVILDKLVESTKEYEKARASMTSSPRGPTLMTVGYTMKRFDNEASALAWLEANYDHISWKDADNGKAPVVHVSESTKLKATNFDLVAASVSAVQKISATNNSGVDVRSGSLNSRVVALDSFGNINLSSVANQNSINSDKTTIKTAQDFASQGNLRVGDFELDAVGDAKLESLAYITHKGDLVHQAKVKADNVTVKADNIKLETTEIVTPEGDISLTAKQNIDVDSTHSEASRYDSVIGDNFGRQISQSANFVEAATLVGNNVKLEAGKDVTLESTKVIGNEKVSIKGESLTTTAKADVSEIHGVEEKVRITIDSQASFGNSVALSEVNLLKTQDINGNVDDENRTFTTGQGAVTAPGAALASTGVTFHKEKTTIDNYKATHVNNQLDAKELTIDVTGNAEIGNTNINTNGKVVTNADMEKTAVINAGSVSQDSAKDIIKSKTEKDAFTLGAELKVSSSIADLTSHITSAARASAKGEQVDGSFAATVVGDTLGLVTRDLLGTTLKLSATKQWASNDVTVVSDSRNAAAGSLVINTSGDTQLKAINTELTNFEVNAKNFTVEGGVTTIDKKFSTSNLGASVEAGVGVGIQGASATSSASIYGSYTDGKTTSVRHDASSIEAQNIKVNVEEKVELKSTYLQADDTVTIKAKEVAVISEQDTTQTISHGGGASMTVGGTLGGATVPFGSAGGYFEKHFQDKAVTGTISTIGGSHVNIETEKLELQSGLIDAYEEGKVTAKEIVVTNNEDHERIDGGRAGVQIGVNKNKATIVDINGGRDRQIDYASTVQSTIANTITINEDAKVVDKAGQAAELNREVQEVVEVHKDVATQETVFDIAYATGTATKLKDIVIASGKTVASVATNAGEAIKNYFTASEASAAKSASTATNSAGYAASTYNPYYTHYVSGVGGYGSGNTGSSYSSNSGSSYSSGGYATGSTGDFGGFGYDSATGSYYTNTGGLDVSNVQLNSANVGDMMNSTRLQFDSFAGERNSGAIEARTVDSIIGKVAKENVRDVYFSDVLSSTNVYNEASNNSGIEFGGASNAWDNTIHTNSQDPGIDFGGVNVPDQSTNVNNGSVIDFGGSDLASSITNNVNSDLNTINKLPTINTGSGTLSGNNNLGTGTSNSGSSFNNGVVGGNGSGTGYGTGTGTSTGTGSGTGSNTGSGFGFGGGAGSTGGSNVDYTNGGGGYELDFGGTTSSTGSSSTASSGSSSTGGSSLTIGNGSSSATGSNSSTTTGSASGELTGNSASNTVVGGSSEGSVSSSGSSSSSVTLTEDSSSTKDSSSAKDTSSSNNNLTSSDSGSTTESTGSKNASGNGGTSSGTASKSEDSTSSSASSSSTTSSSENGVELTEANKQANANKVAPTPADGNAVVGQDIKLSDTAKVTKYQIGDLACYVMSDNQKAIKDLQNGSSSALSSANTQQAFQKYVGEIAKPRATLFSTYSKGIEDAVGNGGVICIPNSSDVMQTDYNVVKSYNDIPIIKSKSESSAEALEAVVVTEKRTVKVKVLANEPVTTSVSGGRTTTLTTKAAPRVVYQPSQMKVSEVAKIKNTLAAKGIDASKIMILGVKSGNDESVADIIKKSANAVR